MRYSKRICAAVLALAMLAVLFGCGAERNSMTLRACITTQPITTLDPVRLSTDGEEILVSHLYENLMKAADNGSGGVTPVAGQAKSYEKTANGDGTVTYRFTLRGGLTWSDGQSVTAEQFAYGWRHLVDINTGSSNAGVLDMVAGYDDARRDNDLSKLQVWTEGDNVFCVTLTYDCPYFLQSVCTSPYTMPERQELVDADPANWSMASPPTNGVYCLKGWDDAGMTLEEKDGYYDTKRTGPTALQIVFADSTESAWKLYTDKQVDFVLGLPQEEADSLAKDAYWSADPYASVYTLLFNQMSMTVSDENLCTAMSLAVDREAVTVLLGKTTHPAATGLIPYGITNYADGTDFRAVDDAIDVNSEDYAKNCETAANLMAGVDRSQMGTIDYLYEQTDENQALAELLQKVWKEKLNLDVTLRGVPTGELNAALQSGEFTLAGLTLKADRDDATAFLKRWSSGNSENYGSFSDNAYDLLLNVSRVSASAKARSAYLEDAETLLIEKSALIPLYFNTQTWELSPTLTGLFRDGLGHYYLTGIRKAAN